MFKGKVKNRERQGNTFYMNVFTKIEVQECVCACL